MSPTGKGHQRPQRQRGGEAAHSRTRKDQNSARDGRRQHTVAAEGSGEAHAFRRDEVVRDIRKDRVGVVMDKIGPNYQLRPPAGGREWEAAAADMEPAAAPDRMKARVAEANAASRRRGGAVL